MPDPAPKGPAREDGDHKGLPVLAFDTAERWDEWLAEHGASTPGIWLKFSKKVSGVASVAKADAITRALAHGWVDGQLDKWDENSWLVRFTPRAPRSKWSEVNRTTAERLIATGEMAPAGLAQVEAARTDGRWDAAYPPQSTAQVPPDLEAALDAEPGAKAFFATLTGAKRYSILYRIHDAKQAKTRAARIEKFVAMLARGETIG